MVHIFPEKHLSQILLEIPTGGSTKHSHAISWAFFLFVVNGTITITGSDIHLFCFVCLCRRTFPLLAEANAILFPTDPPFHGQMVVAENFAILFMKKIEGDGTEVFQSAKIDATVSIELEM